MSAGNETFHVCMRITTLAADEVRCHRHSTVAAGQWGLMRLMVTSKCYQTADPASSQLMTSKAV